jgi:predicted nucleic-acid-binding Zn-ribbon protein
MALSKEKNDEIIKKIEEAIKKKSGKTTFKCPICTNEEFIVTGWFANDLLSDSFGETAEYSGLSLTNIPLICNNCGNTQFLNAKILGFKEEDFPRIKKDGENKNA